MGVPTIPAAAIKALPLGVGVPLMALIASVSPEDLASNLSKWYRHLGWGDPPAWLSDAHFDRKALVVLFSLAIVYSYFAYANPLLRRIVKFSFPGRNLLIKYGELSISVIVCLGVIFLGWQLWPSGPANAPTINQGVTTSAIVTPPQNQKEQLASTLAKLILRCWSPIGSKSRNSKALELKIITKEVKTLLLMQDFDVSDAEVTDVYRAQITPSANGSGTIGSVLNSMMFEERRLNNEELLITEQIKGNGLFGLMLPLATIPLDKDDDKNTQYVSYVEKLFMLPHGSCRLI